MLQLRITESVTWSCDLHNSSTLYIYIAQYAHEVCPNSLYHEFP